MRATALACLIAFAPTRAAAHSPVPGIEGFYIGLLHPLSTAPQILGLLAVGVMLGLVFPRHMGVAWGGFVVAVFAGAAAGAAGVAPALGDNVLLAVAVIAATLAALLPSGQALLRLAISVACGWGLGVVSIPDPGTLRATLITLAGSIVGVNVSLLYVAGGLGWLRERIKAPFGVLALRVLAAWIAAIALLMGALEFAPVDAVSPG